MIPTYDERDHIAEMIKQLEDENLGADILFVDDNSPDGSGDLIELESKKRNNVFIIRRPGKDGIGSAHQTGINYAYAKNYEMLVTMDCDFSHSPHYIPDFIRASGDADVVVGSRYLLKNSLSEWNVMRKVLTYTGHFLTKFLLGMNYDATNAFRLYNLKSIDSDVFSLVKSRSYSFFFESLFILHHNDFSITEIPISLPRRTYGTSKMSYRDIFISLKLLLYMFFRKIFQRRKFLLSPKGTR